MKSTKTEAKLVLVTPVQPNITVKHDGIKYNFETESVELPVNVAKCFIEKGIVIEAIPSAYKKEVNNTSKEE